MILAMGGLNAEAEDPAAVFELRVYHTAEGRLPAMLARFRDHTVGLFTRHGITSVAYWTPLHDPLKGRTLFYILKYPSREDAAKRWKAFQDDPEWIKLKAESEASGKIVENIDSTSLELTDFLAEACLKSYRVPTVSDDPGLRGDGFGVHPATASEHTFPSWRVSRSSKSRLRWYVMPASAIETHIG